MPKRGEVRKLTIEEAERRAPDMVRGQAWTNTKDKYVFNCEKHGRYLQSFQNHTLHNEGCPKCDKEIIHIHACKEGDTPCGRMVKLGVMPEPRPCRFRKGHHCPCSPDLTDL